MAFAGRWQNLAHRYARSNLHTVDMSVSWHVKKSFWKCAQRVGRTIIKPARLLQFCNEVRDVLLVQSTVMKMTFTRKQAKLAELLVDCEHVCCVMLLTPFLLTSRQCGDVLHFSGLICSICSGHVRARCVMKSTFHNGCAVLSWNTSNVRKIIVFCGWCRVCEKDHTS